MHHGADSVLGASDLMGGSIVLLDMDDFQIATFVTGGQWKENCYLVRHIPSGELALIDPGEDNGEIAALVRNWGGGLCYILLTHAHHDHVGAVAPLARQFGLAAHIHRSDVRLLHHAPMYALRFADRKIELPKPYQVLDSESDLRLGEQQIEVIATPGHTAGSVCYRLGGVVFTGDTLLLRHVGRVDLPGADAEAIGASIDRLLRQLPADTVVLPGHGRPWSIGEAQQWWETATAVLPQYVEPGTPSTGGALKRHD